MSGTVRSLIPLALASVSALGFQGDLSFNPRLEGIIGDNQPQAARLGLKIEGGFQTDIFRLRESVYGEADALSTQPKLRRSRLHVFPEESYAEIRLGLMTTRVGMQPIRWSDSWTVPSLDLWTGRRMNRLFFDPMTEQLTYPVAALVSIGNSDVEVSAVGIGYPAVNYFPQPIPDSTFKWDPQGGGRIKVRALGVDLSAVYGRRTKMNNMGGTISYAFDCCVAKIESGWLDSGETKFATFGLDVFVGNWSVLPQFTLLKGERIIYLPVRYGLGAHNFELSYFRMNRAHNAFFGALYGCDLVKNMRLSAFVQTYEGSPGGLFMLFNSMTGGFVGGLRLESFLSI